MSLGVPRVDRAAQRRQATRQEILDAAWATARTAGWEGLTLRRVADQVGMRPPSLYSHFESKGAIVDAMFGAAWEELAERAVRLQSELPEDPRAALHLVAQHSFGYFTADPTRHTLMNLTPVPGFVPSEAAYAPAVRTLELLTRFLHGIGVTEPAGVDLWTALISGLASQQIANDPGGDRWARLVPRAVDMYADEFGLPRTPDSSDTTRTTS